MKKKILVAVGCAVLLLFSASAYSAQGLYLGASLGLTMPTDAGLGFDEGMDVSVDVESESGTGLGVALGYGFSDTKRIECEFTYQSNDLDKMTASYMGESASADLEGDTASMALMVNAYYDFANASPLTPFISAGIGYATVENEITGMEGVEAVLSGSEDDRVLAYQIGAGLGLAVTKSLTLDAKYRYFATGDLDLEGADLEYASHNFYVGIRLGF